VPPIPLVLLALVVLFTAVCPLSAAQTPSPQSYSPPLLTQMAPESSTSSSTSTSSSSVVSEHSVLDTSMYTLSKSASTERTVIWRTQKDLLRQELSSSRRNTSSSGSSSSGSGTPPVVAHSAHELRSSRIILLVSGSLVSGLMLVIVVFLVAKYFAVQSADPNPDPGEDDGLTLLGMLPDERTMRRRRERRRHRQSLMLDRAPDTDDDTDEAEDDEPTGHNSDEHLGGGSTTVPPGRRGTSLAALRVSSSRRARRGYTRMRSEEDEHRAHAADEDARFQDGWDRVALLETDYPASGGASSLVSRRPSAAAAAASLGHQPTAARSVPMRDLGDSDLRNADLHADDPTQDGERSGVPSGQRTASSASPPSSPFRSSSASASITSASSVPPTTDQRADVALDMAAVRKDLGESDEHSDAEELVLGAVPLSAPHSEEEEEDSDDAITVFGSSAVLRV
jgi:hypothetical protein